MAIHVLKKFFGLAVTLLVSTGYKGLVVCVSGESLPYARPAWQDRTFHSPVVDAYIAGLEPKFKDANLGILFQNCLPNTLDTTIWAYNASDTFVITGDINALWLRDSMNQVAPYMRFASSDAGLASLLCGLVRRHAYSVRLDAYANAFNFNNSGSRVSDDARTPPMSDGVFEGKYELDSLMSFLKLSRMYYNATGDAQCFAADGDAWLSAVRRVLQVVEWNQQGTEAETARGWWYSFERNTTTSTDTLMQSGRGPPAAGGVGMSKSYFRASDDSQALPYHIPANAMAVTELYHAARLMETLQGTGTFRKTFASGDVASLSATAAVADRLAQELFVGLARHGIHASGEYLVYEVDGFGSTYFMDDANVPSLLSLPYLGFFEIADLLASRLSQQHEPWLAELNWQALYSNTRARLLSRARNPYFFRSSQAEGIGGPHQGFGQIWPMATVMRALTSEDDQEILDCLDALVQSSAGTGFLHESFNMTDFSDFTRPWFAWVNGLFGELIMHLAENRPELVIG